MRKSIKLASKNFTGAFVANLISAIVTALTVLVIPKFLGITDFSYWQLYIFYVSYVGFMHFGWADGIYLRYGGKYYDKLDKRLFSSQFWLLNLLQTVVLIGFSIFAMLFIEDTNKMLIVILTGVNCLLLNSRTFLQSVLLSTDRIIDFSKNIIAEKVLYIALVVIIIATGLLQYEYLLAADMLAKFVMLVALVYICRDIVFAKLYSFKSAVSEAWANISVGIKLMFANIAGMLVVGVSRFTIEANWGIEKFGKVSLVLTVANLVMVFISAVSIVIFPILKRTDESNLPKIYESLKTMLMVIVLGALILYYPAHYILSSWLPDYADSLIYMALLFPVCVYEAKMSMLITTYLKALRKEGLILTINVLAVALSIVGAVIAAVWLQNLTLTVLMIVIVLAIRATLAEILLARIIPIKIKKDILLEIILTSIFIFVSWFIGGIIAAIIYALAYGIYLLLKSSDIKKMVALIKN